ncbi:hypothetical protein WICPIJ_000846 [Wickerhamomyces pijperi]|uniref:Checkpoint protein n=1 Tax=Wickerhamomyces pijperi TaxID=599730 RepID=A0A9P8TRI1_WICPI|nr:hypothetical protein WICPIJ_000846 [Wickerhamomyces pijperi]
MMLKIVMSNIDVLKSKDHYLSLLFTPVTNIFSPATLASIATIRKDAVFRFTPEMMYIVSAQRVTDPQIWCEISLDIFDQVDVQSKRDNIISFELNIIEFLHILRTYENLNSDQIMIRLQRMDSNVNEPRSKKLSKLSFHFTELNQNNIEVSHSSSVIIRLLSQATDEAIKEPVLDHVNIVGYLPSDISAFFKRMERFKDPKFFEFSLSNKGLLTVSIEGDMKNIEIQWNDLLNVTMIEDTEATAAAAAADPSEEISFMVMIKETHLQLKSKFFEVVKASKMFISENEALVFDCSLEEGSQNRILYFIKGTVRA